ncbi:MAG: glycosyltransferase family 4 protein [Chloroflexi bacterium]|nr:glycosyltransferase family 4 protein [Chloroflexota bacterium]
MHICLMTRTTLAHIGGGLERHAADLCQGLVERGHRITVITTRHPQGETETRAPGIRTLFLPYSADRAYAVAWWRESARAFARLHAADPVDIVWSQGIGAYGYLRLPARQRPIPCVAILHGTPLGEWRAMRRQWGDSPRHAHRLVRFAARTLLFRRMFRTTAQRAAGVICVSPQLAEDAIGELSIPSSRVAVVPNGVDAAKFRPDASARRALRAQLGLAADALVLLTAGRLEQAKGHHRVLRMAASLVEQGLAPTVLVAGTGPDEAWLRQQAASLGLADRVRWLGHVPHEQMPAVYNAADIALMLSIHTEAFSYAVAEPMACGCPVIASAVGGVVSLISHGDNGFLVSPGGEGEAATLAASLARDPAARAAIAQAARQTVLARFTLDRMIADTESVFLRHAIRQGAQP